jgi:hypothetical protein
LNKVEGMTLRELPLAVALASSFAFTFAFTACSDDEEPPTPAADASVSRDATVGRDAVANPDASNPDATNPDAVVADTGQADAGITDALPGDAAEVTLTSIAFQPATLSIVAGESQQLIVVGTYSDSSTAALTTGLTFASSDDTRATVSAEGLLTAVSGGPVTITARSGNLSATLSVTVTAPLRPMFPDIFLDDYTADLSFMEFGGSTNAIIVDTTVQHSGTASLRVEVPAGGYTGGAIRSAVAVDGSPFDAVSFWARASAPHTLNVVGIGNDAATAVLQAEWNAVALTTTWTRYVLPLPNPARFTAQNGVFHFAEGSDEGAYTIWFDDIRYESLGSAVIGAPQPAIATEEIPRAVGETHAINGASVTFPVNGTNQTLALARSWLNYTSSNPAVATVAADGVATAVAPGTADITATLGTTAAAGMTTLVVTAPTLPTVAAPTPTALAANVISLFSNAYTNVTVDTWSAPLGPGGRGRRADRRQRHQALLEHQLRGHRVRLGPHRRDQHDALPHGRVDGQQHHVHGAPGGLRPQRHLRWRRRHRVVAGLRPRVHAAADELRVGQPRSAADQLHRPGRTHPPRADRTRGQQQRHRVRR